MRTRKFVLLVTGLLGAFALAAAGCGGGDDEGAGGGDGTGGGAAEQVITHRLGRGAAVARSRSGDRHDVVERAPGDHGPARSAQSRRRTKRSPLAESWM